MNMELTRDDIITALAIGKEIKMDTNDNFVIQNYIIDDISEMLQDIMETFDLEIPWYLRDDDDKSSEKLIDKIKDRAEVQQFKLLNIKKEFKNKKLYKTFKIDRYGDFVISWD